MKTNYSNPKHVAIVMDGNGRWASKKYYPRNVGHIKGAKVVKNIINVCIYENIRFLTLFAFSTENWFRPEKEIIFLMKIFTKTLKYELINIIRSGIKLKFIGNLNKFNKYLRDLIFYAENKTINNSKITLTIAVNYGGRWDITNAVKSMLNSKSCIIKRTNYINEKIFKKYLSMSWAPDPDLFIRTGGEKRISNFIIWNLVYTELYFTNQCWPEFNKESLYKAFEWYKKRERRFGCLK